MSFQSNYAVRAGGIMIFRTSYPVGNEIQCHETREIQTLEREKEIISKYSSRKKDYWASFGEFSCSESSGRCEGGVSDVRVETIKHWSWGRGNASWKFFWSGGLEKVMSHSQHHIPCGSWCLSHNRYSHISGSDEPWCLRSKVSSSTK